MVLRNKKPIQSIIPVDNAPVDVVLLSDFSKYIQGMRKIQGLGVSKQDEADKILQEYEEVLFSFSCYPLGMFCSCLLSGSAHSAISTHQSGARFGE